MNKEINKELKKAVKEYYNWHGDGKATPIKFIKNKDDVELLVVHFTDSNKDKKISLMTATNWADGHWDVTEMFVGDINDENEMIDEFKESGCEYYEIEEGD